VKRLSHPAAYSLLFRPELRQSSHNGEECDEAVKRASTAAFQVLLDGLAAAQQAGQIRTDRSVEMLALALWSTMHGTTTLLSDYVPIEHVDRLLGEHKAASSLEKVAQLMAHVIQVTAQGLMVRHEEPTTLAAFLQEKR
jgi:Tetracyclin repressor-like, C-terminal domain